MATTYMTYLVNQQGERTYISFNATENQMRAKAKELGYWLKASDNGRLKVFMNPKNESTTYHADINL